MRAYRDRNGSMEFKLKVRFQEEASQVNYRPIRTYGWHTVAEAFATSAQSGKNRRRSGSPHGADIHPSTRTEQSAIDRPGQWNNGHDWRATKEFTRTLIRVLISGVISVHRQLMAGPDAWQSSARFV